MGLMTKFEQHLRISFVMREVFPLPILPRMYRPERRSTSLMGMIWFVCISLPRMTSGIAILLQQASSVLSVSVYNPFVRLQWFLSVLQGDKAMKAKKAAPARYEPL